MHDIDIVPVPGMISKCKDRLHVTHLVMASCHASCSHVYKLNVSLSHIHTHCTHTTHVHSLTQTLLQTIPGLVSFILLSIFPPTRSLFDKVRSTFAGTVEPKKSIAFVMGGAILGMGMTVSGAVSTGSCYSLVC